MDSKSVNEMECCVIESIELESENESFATEILSSCQGKPSTSQQVKEELDFERELDQVRVSSNEILLHQRQSELEDYEKNSNEEPLLDLDIDCCSDVDSISSQITMEDFDFEIQSSSQEQGSVIQERDRQYNCVTCFKPFIHLSYEERATNESPFFCRECGDQFDSESLVEKHYKTHSTECKCYPCNELYDTKTDLVNHQLESHFERFMCNSCALTYCNKKVKQNVSTEKWRRPRRETRLHDYVAYNQRPLKIVYGRCKLCNHLASTKGGMEFHCKKMHPDHELDFEVKCRECDVFFNSQIQLLAHRITSHLNNHFTVCKCNVCQTIESTEIDLLQHFEKSHPSNDLDYAIKCRKCDDFFSSETELQLHSKNICERNKSGKCSECPLVFADLRDLRDHVNRRHHQKDCNKKSAKKRTYSKVFEKLRCGECNEILTYRSDVLRHFERKHPGIESHCEYQCFYCEKFFKTIVDVGRHIYSTHDIARGSKINYIETTSTAFGRCSVCQTLDSKFNLERHFEQAHSEIECKVEYIRFYRKGICHQGESNVIHNCQSCDEHFESKEDLNLHCSLVHRKTHIEN